MTKKERKNYGMLPLKIAESDTVSLDHGLVRCIGMEMHGIPFCIAHGF
jgi:hypothetical protein